MTDHSDAPDDPRRRVEYLRETVDPATVTEADVAAWCELLTERAAYSEATDALHEISSARPDGVRRVAEGLHPYLVHEEKDVWESATGILTLLALNDPDALDTTIDFLLAALQADDERRRATARSVLGELTDVKPVLFHPHVDEFVGYLDHDDVSMHRDAITLLRGISHAYPEAIAPAGDDLLALSRDDSTDVSALPGPLDRIALVRPDLVRPVVEDLRELLTDENHRLRIGAAASLADIAIVYPDELPHVVEELCTLADDGPDDRYPEFARTTAISSLGRVGAEHPDAVVPELPRLMAKLDDENELVRQSVVDAFGVIAAERPAAVSLHVDELVAMLDDEDESVQFSIVETLGKLAAADPAVAPQVVEALHVWLDRAEVVNRARPDFTEMMQLSIVEAFGRIGASSPDAVDPVMDDVLDRPGEWGSTEDVAEVLGEIGAVHPDAVRPAVPDLLDMLGDDRHWNRADAAVALGEIGAADPEVAMLALDDLRMLLDDEPRHGRAAAAEALGTIGAAVPELAPGIGDDVRPLVADDASEVRSAALEALGAIGAEGLDAAERVFEDLQDGLGDVDADVRLSAATVLGTVGAAHPELAPVVGEALRSRLERDDEYRYVRSPIAGALQTIADSHPDAVSIPASDLQAHRDPVASSWRE